MPITLITGTPGAGKTLFAVKTLVETLLPLGRKIYSNINGLNVSNPLLEVVGDDAPLEWQSYPDGSIFIFDEVQRQYPFKNAMSKVPEYISGYQTHRHKGMDFYFITQGPHLLDRHLFPLIDRHFHIYRPFGLRRSTVLEWNGVNPTPAPLQSRSNAIVKNFRFPKKYFEFYKSATVHTVKARVPWKVVTVVGGLFVFITGTATYAYFSLSDSQLFTDQAALTQKAALDAQLAFSGGDGSVDPSSRSGCAHIVAATPSGFTLSYRGKRFRVTSDELNSLKTSNEGLCVVTM